MSVGVQFAAASVLTIFTTAQSVLVELVKVDGHIPFHTPSAVMYTEAMKLCVALSIWAWQCRQLEYTGLENLTFKSVLSFAVPATLFIIQNNVTFRAMQLLDPPTYQLWACFKLIHTGLLSRTCLGQRRSSVQWCALLLLALGMATTKLDLNVNSTCKSSAEQPHARTARHLQGIGWMLLNGCLSATSGVANEWLIKVQDPNAPLMLKNAQAGRRSPASSLHAGQHDDRYTPNTATTATTFSTTGASPLRAPLCANTHVCSIPSHFCRSIFLACS